MNQKPHVPSSDPTNYRPIISALYTIKVSYFKLTSEKFLPVVFKISKLHPLSDTQLGFTNYHWRQFSGINYSMMALRPVQYSFSTTVTNQLM